MAKWLSIPGWNGYFFQSPQQRRQWSCCLSKQRFRSQVRQCLSYLRHINTRVWEQRQPGTSAGLRARIFPLDVHSVLAKSSFLCTSPRSCTDGNHVCRQNILSAPCSPPCMHLWYHLRNTTVQVMWPYLAYWTSRIDSKRHKIDTNFQPLLNPGSERRFIYHVSKTHFRNLSAGLAYKVQ